MSNNWTPLLVEVGLGVEQHGQDPTKAAIKAIRDAIQRVCIPYLVEKQLLKSGRIKLEISIGVPYHDRVDIERIKKEIPLEGDAVFKIVEGGLKTKCAKVPELGDKSDEMFVAVASITLYIKENTDVIGHG